MNIVFLISQPPSFCPNCGDAMQIARDYFLDFIGGASMSCDCGSRFCYAPVERLVSLADQLGSDLPQYVKGLLG
jgi:hypothetical protein